MGLRKNSVINKKMKNIIFLVDAQQSPSGGGKIIYQYSNYINSLKNYSSSVAQWIDGPGLSNQFQILAYRHARPDVGSWKTSLSHWEQNQSYPGSEKWRRKYRTPYYPSYGTHSATIHGKTYSSHSAAGR